MNIMIIIKIICKSNNSWIIDFFTNFLPAISVAVVAYFLFGKLDEYKKRRSYSKLGASIMLSLIEELKEGLKFMNKVLDPKDSTQPFHLPRKSWDGVNTIPDEVLLRILEVSHKETTEGFPLEEIRIHTKNYFSHMVPNWDVIVTMAQKGEDFKSHAQNSFSNYKDAAEKVLMMVEHCKTLLEINSKRIIPK